MECLLLQELLRDLVHVVLGLLGLRPLVAFRSGQELLDDLVVLLAELLHFLDPSQLLLVQLQQLLLEASQIRWVLEEVLIVLDLVELAGQRLQQLSQVRLHREIPLLELLALVHFPLVFTLVLLEQGGDLFVLLLQLLLELLQLQDIHLLVVDLLLCLRDLVLVYLYLGLLGILLEVGEIRSEEDGLKQDLDILEGDLAAFPLQVLEDLRVNTDHSLLHSPSSKS